MFFFFTVMSGIPDKTATSSFQSKLHLLQRTGSYFSRHNVLFLFTDPDLVLSTINNNITSTALTSSLGDPSSEAQQNKIVNHFQEPETHRSHHQLGAAHNLRWRRNLEKVCFKIYGNRKYFHKILMSLGVRSKCAATEKVCLPRIPNTRSSVYRAQCSMLTWGTWR